MGQKRERERESHIQQSNYSSDIFIMTTDTKAPVKFSCSRLVITISSLPLDWYNTYKTQYPIIKKSEEKVNTAVTTGMSWYNTYKTLKNVEEKVNNAVPKEYVMQV